MAAAQAIDAGLEVAEAVASSTGVFKREERESEPREPRRRDNLAWIAIAFLLLGGGGATTLTGALDGDGSEALAKTVELEAKIEGLADELEHTAKKVETVEVDTARMLRQQARVLAWLVEASQRQSAALAAVARSAGVEVDLSAPPLLPEVGND